MSGMPPRSLLRIKASCVAFDGVSDGLWLFRINSAKEWSTCEKAATYCQLAGALLVIFGLYGGVLGKPIPLECSIFIEVVCRLPWKPADLRIYPYHKVPFASQLTQRTFRMLIL